MTTPLGTRVVLRPVATPLPLGFLALALATVAFSAVQLGWVAPDQGRIAGLAAVAFYTALGMELESTTGRTVLPLGRRGPARAAVEGRGPLSPSELAGEAGVRPQL